MAKSEVQSEDLAKGDRVSDNNGNTGTVTYVTAGGGVVAVDSDKPNSSGGSIRTYSETEYSEKSGNGPASNLKKIE